MMGLYIHYKQGYLPVAGGILDQSQWFLSGIELMMNVITLSQKRQLDEIKRKAGQGGGA